MPISDRVITTGGKQPLRMFLYSRQGWGKTTFASQMPNPLFLLTEQGTGRSLKVNATTITSYDDLISVFQELSKDPKHGYKTIVIDTVTGLEPMVAEKVLSDYKGKKDTTLNTLDAIGYGKGYTTARALWRDIADWVTWFRDNQKVSVILLAHALIKMFNNPSGENFDWWQISLDKNATEVLTMDMDVVAFGDFFIEIKGEGTEKKKAQGKPKRKMFLTNGATWTAKARSGWAKKSELSMNDKETMWKIFTDNIGDSENEMEVTEEQKGETNGATAE